MPHQKLGEILLARGGVRPEQLAEALEAQRATKDPILLGEILISRGFTSPDAVKHAVVEQIGKVLADPHADSFLKGLARSALEACARARFSDDTTRELVRVLLNLKERLSEAESSLSRLARLPASRPVAEQIERNEAAKRQILAALGNLERDIARMEWHSSRILSD